MTAGPGLDPPMLTGWADWLRRVGSWHPEWTLAGVAAAAWSVLAVAHLAGGGHTGHAAGAGTWWGAQAGWLLMVPAMMIPPALPMARGVALNSKWHRRQRAAALFAAASLVVWLGFGLVAVPAAYWAAPVPIERSFGLLLLLGAVWELTPAKRRFLRLCHRTIPLPPDGRKADRACLQLGLRYGRSCLGACWALMLPMAFSPGGAPGLATMGVLTAIPFAQETRFRGDRFARPAAAVLAALGAIFLLAV